MKALVGVLLLIAGSVASAQQSQTITNGWGIGGDYAGPLGNPSREIRSTVIEEGNKRRVAALTDEMTLHVNPYFVQVTRDWVRGALNGDNPARDVHFLAKGKATLYKASKITEFTLPALRRRDQWDDDTCDT